MDKIKYWTTGSICFKDDIDKTSTVEAIPIEWIEEWQNSHEWEYESFFTIREGIPKYPIECMIEGWGERK